MIIKFKIESPHTVPNLKISSKTWLDPTVLLVLIQIQLRKIVQIVNKKCRHLKGAKDKVPYQTQYSETQTMATIPVPTNPNRPYLSNQTRALNNNN